MAREEVEKLKKEIETLLRENQRLKVALKIQFPHNGNGNGHNLKPIERGEKADSALLAMAEQLKQIRGLHRAMSDSIKMISSVESSIEAIIPALDLQLKGYDATITQLREFQEESESAYAGVVKKLENQIREIRQDFSETEQVLHQNYKKQIEEMQARITILETRLTHTTAELEDFRKKEEKQIAETPANKDNNPFSSLSIFGI
ncbi:MAG: hypothetical protein SF052_17105 [Bacteroidia bacterium]|nr:hypothetical protein [Bacteroidia bacterium]